MLDAILEYFSTADFMPHGHCYLWKAPLVSLHVSSDALIGTAYVVIAGTLWALVRRIRLPFTPMFLAFGTFIGACGLTHYMEVYTLWTPDYWLSGLVKFVTALASVATGAYLVKLKPTITTVAEGARLAEERRVELESKNRELQRLYGQVKALDDARTRFFANASHELRTPLALVLGAVEKALPGCEGEGRRDLEVARRNARVLLRHVNDLLDAARVEEGRMPVRWARADLAELVREVAAQFELAADERKIALDVVGPEPVVAEVDAEKIQRVVANLLGNAFQFVPDGGRVRATISREGGAARIVVEDTGPGVPPELREAIFDRFRQDERLARHGGSGLGLSIARDFAELHRGTIAAGDAEGGGARFTVTLPLSAPAGSHVAPAPLTVSADAHGWAADSARAPAPAAVPEAAGPEAPSALVVEDNLEMSRFVAAELAKEFRVAVAADGADGLQQAEALRPDVVVTDVMMPKLGGEELLRELRRRPALTDVPVIVLTARDEEELRVRLLKSGAQDFLVKPFHPEELRVRARNAARAKRTKDVLEASLASRSRDLEEAARDVAHRKRDLERALDTARIAREQAERAAKVKSVFLGMASHELRTPLTSMRLSIEALKVGKDAPLSPRQQENVRRVDQAARRLLALVESLLEYTRVETGRLVVAPEPFDLASVVAAVVEEVLPQAQRKLLALTLEPAAADRPVPPVVSDPRLVRLVLVNLVVNAVKYTETGAVTVAVGAGDRGTWFEVRDTGQGIPVDAQARIFEPFEQVENADPGQATGVGLGLSLVKGIVDALGARIRVQSEPGKGSTFRVELPERPPEQRPAAPAARA